MLKEFRDFVLRGNVIDLAIGVIIGAAFGTIVKSLVDDIIMPPIGLLLGGVDFSNLFIALDGSEHASLAAAREAGAPVIAYGAFINTIISFIIVAFAIFITIKQVNKMFMKKKAAPPPAAKPRQEELLEEIRDALKAKRP
jgi:large conductance mechanosensitive channel